MSEAADTVAAGGPVTVLVARRVRPGMEIEFEDWAEELTRAASEFHGFLGAGLLRPGHAGDDVWQADLRLRDCDRRSGIGPAHIACGRVPRHASSSFALNRAGSLMHTA